MDRRLSDDLALSLDLVRSGLGKSYMICEGVIGGGVWCYYLRHRYL